MIEVESGFEYLKPDRAFRRNSKCTVISNLSGGLDSVLGTYQLLKQGEYVLIHHCYLSSTKGRMKYEAEAVKKALDFYRSQGLTNFVFIDSAVTLPPSTHLHRLRDPEIIMALTGNILRSRPHIKRVAYWNIIGDTSTETPDCEAAQARVEMMYICARRRDITIERPLGTWTKGDVIRAMPKELFQASFWCRVPLDGGGSCRHCKTCRQVYEYLPVGYGEDTSDE